MGGVPRTHRDLSHYGDGASTVVRLLTNQGP
jgi:hypothetical protein